MADDDAAGVRCSSYRPFVLPVLLLLRLLLLLLLLLVVGTLDWSSSSPLTRWGRVEDFAWSPSHLPNWRRA